MVEVGVVAGVALILLTLNNRASRMPALGVAAAIFVAALAVVVGARSTGRGEFPQREFVAYDPPEGTAATHTGPARHSHRHRSGCIRVLTDPEQSTC
jgi:hypothetical protein